MNKSFEETKILKTEQNKISFTQANLKSTSNQAQLEEDDFWKDCIELETKVSTNENRDLRTSKNSDNEEIYLTFNEFRNDGKISKKVKQEQKSYTENYLKTNSNIPKINPNIEEKFKKLSNKLGLEKQEMDRTTTHASLSMGNKKNSSIDRCFLLYEKGKIKNEVNKLIIQKNYELKEKQLLSKCTFKPITNSVRFITPTSIKDSNKSSSIYDRNEYWNKNKLEKIEKGKNMILRNENYPFHPQINKKNSQAIFNPDKNVINDYTARSHMMRLEKARFEAKTKIEKQYFPIKNKYQGKYKRMLSVSADNSICYDERENIKDSIKHLHHELHSITYEENII